MANHAGFLCQASFPKKKGYIVSLPAVERTVLFTREKIVEIRDLMERTLEIAREKLPSRAYSKELVELLFRHPYTKGQFAVDAGIVKRQAAA